MVLSPSERDVLMISAGVGITPMLAHLRAFRDLPPPEGGLPRLSLLQCDRVIDQSIALAELHEFEASGLLSEMTLIQTKGDPNRRISRAQLAKALGAPGPLRRPTVLLCGPEQFMYPIKRILIDDLRLDPGLICFDDFTF